MKCDKIHTAVPLASPTDMEEPLVQLEAKQGSKNPGNNYKRSFIIVMAIYGLIPAAIGLITSLLVVIAGVIAAKNPDPEDEDGVAAFSIFVAEAAGNLAIMFFLQTFGYVFRLVAAIKYNVCMLTTVFIFDLIKIVGSIGNESIGIFGIFFAACISYATIGLLLEIKERRKETKMCNNV